MQIDAVIANMPIVPIFAADDWGCEILSLGPLTLMCTATHMVSVEVLELVDSYLVEGSTGWEPTTSK